MYSIQKLVHGVTLVIGQPPNLMSGIRNKLSKGLPLLFCVGLWMPVGGVYAKAVPKPTKNSKDTTPVKLIDFDNLKPGKVLYLTLPDAIVIALRKNPGIDQAYLKRSFDKISLAVERREFIIKPTLGVSGVTVDLQDIANSPLTTAVTPGFEWKTPIGTTITGSAPFTWARGSEPSYSVNFGIKQPLLKGFGTDINRIKLRRAEDTEISKRLALKSTIISTIGTVITDYRSLQSNEKNLNTNIKTLKRAIENLNRTKKYIAAGRNPQSDLIAAEARVASQRVDILAVEDTLTQARAKLANDLGLNAEVRIVVPTQVVMPRVIPDEAKSYQLALENSPEYLNLLITLRNAKRSLLQARDGARWGLSLDMSFKHDFNQAGGLTSFNQGAGATLSLTFPFGVTAHLTDERDIAQQQIAVQDALRAIQTYHRNTLNDIRSQILSIKVSLTKVDEAEKALKYQVQVEQYTQRKFELGLISAFQLNEEQQSTQTKEESLTAARVSYLNSLKDFDAKLGTTLQTWHVKVNY